MAWIEHWRADVPCCATALPCHLHPSKFGLFWCSCTLFFCAFASLSTYHFQRSKRGRLQDPLDPFLAQGAAPAPCKYSHWSAARPGFLLGLRTHQCFSTLFPALFIIKPRINLGARQRVPSRADKKTGARVPWACLGHTNNQLKGNDYLFQANLSTLLRFTGSKNGLRARFNWSPKNC